MEVRRHGRVISWLQARGEGGGMFRWAREETAKKNCFRIHDAVAGLGDDMERREQVCLDTIERTIKTIGFYLQNTFARTTRYKPVAR